MTGVELRDYLNGLSDDQLDAFIITDIVKSKRGCDVVLASDIKITKVNDGAKALNYILIQ